MRYYLKKIIDYFYLILVNIFIKNKSFNQPFFILSPGRSGSTLLRKEIIAYTNANIPPETGDLLVKSAKIYINNLFRSNHTRKHKILKEFIKDPNFHYWNLDAEILIKKISKVNLSSYSEIISFIYSEYALKYGFDTSSWGDKTPYLSERISWLKSLFPKAKYIFIDRNTESIKNSRMKFFNETENAALKRIRNSRKAVNKAYGNNLKILFITLEDFLDQRELKLNRILYFLELNKLKQPIKNFYLGDDILKHHSKLHQNLN